MVSQSTVMILDVFRVSLAFCHDVIFIREPFCGLGECLASNKDTFGFHLPQLKEPILCKILGFG